jgi:hypothetical protein
LMPGLHSFALLQCPPVTRECVVDIGKLKRELSASRKRRKPMLTPQTAPSACMIRAAVAVSRYRRAIPARAFEPLRDAPRDFRWHPSRSANHRDVGERRDVDERALPIIFARTAAAVRFEGRVPRSGGCGSSPNELSKALRSNCSPTTVNVTSEKSIGTLALKSPSPRPHIPRRCRNDCRHPRDLRRSVQRSR